MGKQNTIETYVTEKEAEEYFNKQFQPGFITFPEFCFSWQLLESFYGSRWKD